MLRKIRVTLAVVCFTLITLLFLDFTGTLHAWFGWLAKIQFLPAVLALNVGVIVALLALTLLSGRRRGICGCDQPAGPRFAGEKRGRHRLQALRAAYRQPYAYRPVSVGNPLRRIANARRVPGTGNGFYRDDETGGIGAAGAFRLLSGMRVICSTLYKETAPGYFRPERESVRFGIFSSFFAGSCWNKADCFRIFV